MKKLMSAYEPLRALKDRGIFYKRNEVTNFLKEFPFVIEAVYGDGIFRMCYYAFNYPKNYPCRIGRLNLLNCHEEWPTYIYSIDWNYDENNEFGL